MADILVLYYSRHGSTANLAAQIGRGINSVEGATAMLRTVPEVSAETEAVSPTIPSQGAPYVSREDLAACEGLILGSPTRFGNMSASLKYFLDSTAGEWMSGQLRGKPAGLFTSSSSQHGGQESTLLTMGLPLIHHGMVLVGVPYSEPALTATKTGGTPYGASHIAYSSGDITLSKEEAAIASCLGQRVAEAALRLQGWDRP